MKRFLTIPRWVSVPAAAGFAVGLIALYYPGGLAAAYEDLRDSGELNQRLSEHTQTHRELDVELVRTRDRVEYKHQLVTALVRGETTLSAVADEFVELNRSDERILLVQRAQYGELGVDELAARSVLDFIEGEGFGGETSSVVRDRLVREYEARFGRPPAGRPSSGISPATHLSPGVRLAYIPPTHCPAARCRPRWCVPFTHTGMYRWPRKRAGN